MSKIVIDAGHGGKDPGAVCESLGIKEKDINLAVALLTRRYILRNNHSIIPYMTRINDDFYPLRHRCDFANGRIIGHGCPNGKIDAFVSIHTNARHRIGKAGLEMEIFFYSSKRARKLAEILRDYLTISFDYGIEVFFRGIKEKGFYVLKHTAMPAVLVELGFLTDPEEALWLNQRQNQRKLAKRLSKGIQNYLN